MNSSVLSKTKFKIFSHNGTEAQRFKNSIYNSSVPLSYLRSNYKSRVIDFKKCIRFNFARTAFIFLLFFTFCSFSCSSGKLEERELSFHRDGALITVMKAEIARTQEERAQGLMHRQSLADGEGMLFVFERDEVLSFWMKNTYIPLSIAFITSGGTITEIKDMIPHNTNPVLSSRSVRYALEVPQGWFTRAGIEVGDIVNLELIR